MFFIDRVLAWMFTTMTSRRNAPPLPPPEPSKETLDKARRDVAEKHHLDPDDVSDDAARSWLREHVTPAGMRRHE